MSDPKQQSSLNLPDVEKMTPAELLQIAGRLTIKSWLILVGLIVMIGAGAFRLGWSYRNGSLPGFAYVLHVGDNSPIEEREQSEDEATFKDSYSNLIDWQTLRAISAGIADHHPDGLGSYLEISASLLAQVRATRGSASFLAGAKQISVRITATDPDTLDLKWEESPSIVRRIASDAGYDISDDELRLVNANLNRTQFAYLDDEMQHAVIYRNIDGHFGLTIEDG